MKNSKIASHELVAAARERKTDLCLSLIALGADVNMPDRHENLPLFTAVSYLNIDTAMALLAHGADILIRHKNSSNSSILHHAYNWPLADYVRLIDMGADVNALTKHNLSPLHFASQVGHAQALLFAGAHPDIRSNTGLTPLSNAVISSNIRVDLGAMPLSNAISLNNCQLIELLVNAGADPNAESVHRSSHLMEAQSKNNLEIASLLIALGAESKGYKGRNAMWQRLFSLPPLHAAASGGHTGAALALVKKGVDPTNLFLRKTAAQFAIKNGFPETAAMLQAAEASFAVDQILANSRTISARLPRV